MRYLAALVAVVALDHAAVAQAPLPELSPFLREVRLRLQTDGQRQYDYSFVERQRQTTVDADGRLTAASTATIESRPGLRGQGRWECVLERDGKRVAEDELRGQIERRRRQDEDYRRFLSRQTDADRARQEREWAKQRRELADTLDDVFRVFEIHMLGRESVEGRDTVVLSLTPRQEAAPVSDDGRWFTHFEGRAWISEADYEVARLDVEALDDVNVGFGLLARVHQGTRAVLERRKLAEGPWLPARSTVTMSVRALLLKRIRQEVTSEYSGYHRGAGEGSCIIPP